MTTPNLQDLMIALAAAQGDIRRAGDSLFKAQPAVTSEEAGRLVAFGDAEIHIIRAMRQLTTALNGVREPQAYVDRTGVVALLDALNKIERDR